MAEGERDDAARRQAFVACEGGQQVGLGVRAAVFLVLDDLVGYFVQLSLIDLVSTVGGQKATGAVGRRDAQGFPAECGRFPVIGG